MADEGSLSVQISFPVESNTVSRSLSSTFDKTTGNTYLSTVLEVLGSDDSRTSLLNGVTSPTLAVIRNTGDIAVDLYNDDNPPGGVKIGSIPAGDLRVLPIPATGTIYAISTTTTHGELEVIVPGV